MKKILALTLMLVILSAVFFGCGLSGDNYSAPVKMDEENVNKLLTENMTTVTDTVIEWTGYEMKLTGNVDITLGANSNMNITEGEKLTAEIDITQTIDVNSGAYRVKGTAKLKEHANVNISVEIYAMNNAIYVKSLECNGKKLANIIISMPSNSVDSVNPLTDLLPEITKYKSSINGFFSGLDYTTLETMGIEVYASESSDFNKYSIEFATDGFINYCKSLTDLSGQSAGSKQSVGTIAGTILSKDVINKLNLSLIFAKDGDFNGIAIDAAVKFDDMSEMTDGALKNSKFNVSTSIAKSAETVTVNTDGYHELSDSDKTTMDDITKEFENSVIFSSIINER